jgi:outer membrane protein assembly factor BamB
MRSLWYNKIPNSWAISLAFSLVFLIFIIAPVQGFMFRADLPHTGVYPDGGVSNGLLRWNFTTGGHIYSSPAIVDDVVYVGSNDNKVYALNAATGALLWSYTTGHWVSSSPAVSSGIVYVGSFDNKVYALNAATGVLLWSYTTGDIVRSSPAVSDGVVYVGSYDNKVYALNAATGVLLWSYTTGDIVRSSPAISGGIVYVGSYDNKVYALNAATGALLWSYTTGSTVDSSPAISGGIVYVGSFDNKVYALNAATGVLLWSYTTGGSVTSSPAVSDGIVYVGSYDNKVYALNAVTGALLWSYTTGDIVGSSPAIANGVVYVGSNDNKVYALNAATGTLLWSYTTSHGIYVVSSPAVADGVVYFGSEGIASEGGKLYALGTDTCPTVTGISSSSNPPVAKQSFYIYASGYNLVQGSQIQMDGVSLSTTFISSNQIKGYVTSNNATPGVHSITVYLGGSCGTSNPISLTIPSLSVTCPTITDSYFSRIQPIANQDFWIYLTGYNLTQNVKLRMDSEDLPTTFLSSKKVKGYVSSSKSTQGYHSLVINFGGSCGISNRRQIFIAPRTPKISYISPSRIKASSASFTLYVYGTNFASTSEILWNKKTIPSKIFYSSTKLAAIVPRSWVKNRGSASIEVYTTNMRYSYPVTFTIY